MNMREPVKTRKRRIPFILSVLVLILGCVFFSDIGLAAEYVISNDVIPTIELRFNEITHLEETYLVEEGNLFDQIPVEITTSDNITFHIQPERALRNGNYILQFTAYDRIGNVLEGPENGVTFTIDSVETGIRYLDPPHGVASSTNYDVTIQTDDQSTCKYSLVYFSDTAFSDDPTISTFGNSTQPQYFHTIPQFNMRVNEQFPTTIHVKCEDTLPRINYREMTFTLDTTKPKLLSLVADPRKITYPTEINGGTFLTTNLRTEADEKVMCKYSQNDTSYENMHWFNSSFSAPNATRIDRQYFTTQDKTRLIFSNFSKSTKSYYVQCENLAGLRSEKKHITVEVDLGASLQIDVEQPQPFTNASSQELILTTNKPAFCEYSLNPDSGEFYPMDSASNNLLTRHQASLGSSFSHGQHDLVIKCTSDSVSIKNYGFTVDTTAPTLTNFTHSLPSIENQSTGSGSKVYTYFTDELSARWDTSEDYSPIKEYEYQIQNAAGDIILNWTTTSQNDVTVKNLDLDNLETYYWFVRAQNEVGMWSSTFKSVGVLVDTSLQPEDFHCENGETDYDETDVDCGGSCEGCEIDESCESDSDCESENCADGTCQQNSCSNGVLDGTETAIDCGGDCTPCENGETCVADVDCQSLFCDNSICAEASCSDGIKNGHETDVDCGGNTSCPRCSLQQSCLENTDCTSNYCTTNYVCGLVSCHNGILDEDEEDVDCGGPCKPCSRVACDTDSECPSGRCNMTAGYCVPTVEKNVSKPTSATTDSDGDGMPDVWENEFGFDPNDPSDAQKDFDSDQLKNVKEYDYGTDPLYWDSDNDGVSDGEEVLQGYDPLDSDSKPKNQMLWLWILLLLLVIVTIGGYVGYTKYAQKAQSKGFDPKLALKNLFTKKGTNQQKGKNTISSQPTMSRGQSQQRTRDEGTFQQSSLPNPSQRSASSYQPSPSTTSQQYESSQPQERISAAHKRFLREQRAKQRRRDRLFSAFDTSDASTELTDESDENTPNEKDSVQSSKTKKGQNVDTEIDATKNSAEQTKEEPSLAASEAEKRTDNHTKDNINTMFSNLRKNKKQPKKPKQKEKRQRKPTKKDVDHSSNTQNEVETSTNRQSDDKKEHPTKKAFVKQKDSKQSQSETKQDRKKTTQDTTSQTKQTEKQSQEPTSSFDRLSAFLGKTQESDEKESAFSALSKKKKKDDSFSRLSSYNKKH
jgi:hypothetical protein